MARPSKFSADGILDAAAEALLEHGRQVSIAQIAAAAHAPTGSVYHRFDSREELLIRLWLRSIKGFQAHFIRACTDPDPHRAVVQAALSIPDYCREHPARANAMRLYRRIELLDAAPAGLLERVETLNDEIDAVCEELGRRRYPRLDERRRALLSTAVRLSPYGLVRPFIGGPIPAWLDDAVAASTRAIAALGDE